MRSVLLFLLIFSSSEASSEETSNETSELQSPVSVLADTIYDKQKECDAIVGEAVVKALEKGITNKFPIPDERYLQCRKTLDEKKKEYIKTALIGLSYYSKLFPMVLSNKQFVTLPVPVDDSLSTSAEPEFDIQQELCMTNKLCLTLVRLKFSKYDTEDITEQKKSVSRCLSFLNDLKLKYVDMKKKEGKVFEKQLGLPVMCTNGEVTLTLPNNEKDIIYHGSTPSMASEIPEITPAAEHVLDNKGSTTNKLESYDPYRDSYDKVVKELKSTFEQKSKKKEIADQISENELPSSESEDDERPTKEEIEKDKSVIHDETTRQEGSLSDFKSNEVRTENQDVSDYHVNEISLSDNKPDNEISRSESSEDVDTSQEEEKLNTSKSEDIKEIAMSEPTEDDDSSQEEEELNTSKSEDIKEIATNKPSGDIGRPQENEKSSAMNSEDTQEINQNTKLVASENTPTPTKTETTPNNDNEATDKRAESTTKKSIQKRPQKTKDDDNVELVSYRVRMVTKNGNGKVVTIQAYETIKKTESGNPTSNQPSPTIHPTSDGVVGTKSVIGLVIAPEKINETQRRRHPDSLEDNIILMENDCKELIQFGEQLSQHKMLRSLIHLENHYNECIKRLDTLKKMYIEKHHLDVMSHKHFFPLTLPSGVMKLVPLPTPFLKAELVETQTSNLKSDDVFELGEIFRKTLQSDKLSLNQRKPFDDPAFISNAEFLKSLQQGAAPSGTSTLSKVASMLHMNGGHADKTIAE